MPGAEAVVAGLAATAAFTQTQALLGVQLVRGSNATASVASVVIACFAAGAWGAACSARSAHRAARH